MLMGITYVSQQSSRDGMFAKAWGPTHSSSTARARAGAGKREWFAGDHGSQARIKSSQASIPDDSAESTPPPVASQALASANGVVAGVLVTSLPQARGSAPARKSFLARGAEMQLMWWSGVRQPRLSMSHARTCACAPRSGCSPAHCLGGVVSSKVATVCQPSLWQHAPA
jgi:hypothetical protein